MPNTTSRQEIKKPSHKDSGYGEQRTKRTTLRPINLNLERFVLDECNMTQSQKYSADAGGIISSKPKKRDSGQIKTTGVGTSTSGSKVHVVPVPPQPRSTCVFSCGWLSCSLVGVLCLTFLLCIILIPSEGIFPVGIDLFEYRGQPFNKTGDIVVYPGEVGKDAISRRVTDSFVISTHPDNFNHLINVLNKVTSEYNKSMCTDIPKPYVNCYLENPNENKPCYFEREWLGNGCVQETGYGYREIDGFINPCFMVRILHSEKWYPINWSPQEVSDKYKEMYGTSFIGFSCQAQRRQDRDKVKFTHNPVKGFPQDFFPNSRFNADEYIYPAVMVQVHGLRVGQNMTVTCQLRARNAYELRGSGSIVITFTGLSTIVPMPAKARGSQEVERTLQGSSLEKLTNSEQNINITSSTSVVHTVEIH